MGSTGRQCGRISRFFAAGNGFPWMIFCFGMVMLCFGSNVFADARSHVFSTTDLLNVYRISDPQISPDGKRVAFSVSMPETSANRIRQSIYFIEITGQNPKGVTPDNIQATNGRFSPDGHFLYFLAEADTALAQVWRISLPDGKASAVTDLPLGVDGFEIGPDGTYLLLSIAVLPGKTPKETRAVLQERNRLMGKTRVYDRLPVRHWNAWRDGTRNHLFVYHLQERNLRDLMGDMDADCPSRPFGGTDDFSFSPDGKAVVFSAKAEGLREAWSTNYDLFWVPVDGSAPPKRITSNPATDIQPRFSPDGKTLAYLAASRQGHEADRLRIVLRDLRTGNERTMDPRAHDASDCDRSPDFLVWSPDSRRIYWTADHLGEHALFSLNLATGKNTLFMKTGSTTFTRPLADGRVLFAWSSLQRPAELYIAGLDGGENRRLTKMNDARTEEIRMGKTGTFTFKGSRGHTVYGRLVYPADFDPSRKYPVAFLIHGGPQTSHLNEFSYRWNPQVFAGAGYAVVTIDFPGSTGYGQSYTDAVSGDWGGAPYEDLAVGLTVALKQYPFLDRGRMAALGASFGGYMVNWMAGRDHPFRCLVSHAGIFERDRFFYQTDELWFAEWEAGGLPWTNPQGHRQHNPADRIKDWRTPTLFLHGEQDFRVPLTQSLSAFTALQRRGVPSKLIVFPDEGHWILKPQNTFVWYQAILDWLGRWMKQ